jgi:hypothetical protein
MAWHGMAMAWLKTKAKIKIHVKIAKMENCQKSIIQIKKKDFLCLCFFGIFGFKKEKSRFHVMICDYYLHQ